MDTRMDIGYAASCWIDVDVAVSINHRIAGDGTLRDHRCDIWRVSVFRQISLRATSKSETAGDLTL
jgi:hypothetical protein